MSVYTQEKFHLMIVPCILLFFASLVKLSCLLLVVTIQTGECIAICTAMEKGKLVIYLFYGTVILYLKNQHKYHFYCLKIITIFKSLKNVVFSEDWYGTKNVTKLLNLHF